MADDDRDTTDEPRRSNGEVDGCSSDTRGEMGVAALLLPSLRFLPLNRDGLLPKTDVDVSGAIINHKLSKGNANNNNACN